MAGLLRSVIIKVLIHGCFQALLEHIQPMYDNRPLEFITSQSISIDAQQCMLITAALR